MASLSGNGYHLVIASLFILFFSEFYVLMNGFFFSFQVEVFGSFRTGLYLPTSDIDVSSVNIVILNLPYKLVDVAG